MRNKVKDAWGTRSIFSRTFRANQPLGGSVCKYGRSTLFTCGELAGKNVWAFWVPSGASTYMEVQPTNGADLVNEGDSGGPVYLSNSAYGLVEAEWQLCACHLIYTAVNYVESGLGVRVLTN